MKYSILFIVFVILASCTSEIAPSSVYTSAIEELEEMKSQPQFITYCVFDKSNSKMESDIEREQKGFYARVANRLQKPEDQVIITMAYSGTLSPSNVHSFKINTAYPDLSESLTDQEVKERLVMFKGNVLKEKKAILQRIITAFISIEATSSQSEILESLVHMDGHLRGKELADIDICLFTDGLQVSEQFIFKASTSKSASALGRKHAEKLTTGYGVSDTSFSTVQSIVMQIPSDSLLVDYDEMIWIAPYWNAVFNTLGYDGQVIVTGAFIDH